MIMLHTSLACEKVTNTTPTSDRAYTQWSIGKAVKKSDDSDLSSERRLPRGEEGDRKGKRKEGRGDPKPQTQLIIYTFTLDQRSHVRAKQLEEIQRTVESLDGTIPTLVIGDFRVYGWTKFELSPKIPDAWSVKGTDSENENLGGDRRDRFLFLGGSVEILSLSSRLFIDSEERLSSRKFTVLELALDS
jgi:hypothetical protein